MKKILFATILFAVAFSSCGKKSMNNGAMPQSASFASLEKKAAVYDFAAEVVDEMAEYEADEAGATYGNQAIQDVERKLVFTGYVSVEVENLADAKTAVETWAKKYGGYISNSSESQRYEHFTVNIPQENFFAAMNESGSLGKVKNKDTNSRDVTEQFYDLKTRLDTRRVLLERLQNYLATAKDMKDLIEVETKINNVTSELEQMQGQMNRLQKQISFSQIEVDISLPANHNENGFILPDTKNELRVFLGNIASFFVNFFFVLLYIFIFGVPIVLAIILIYWLAFGKIGLVRRLFNKIKK